MGKLCAHWTRANLLWSPATARRSDLDRLTAEVLPDDMTIAAISLAEIAAGPHATNDPIERASRQERLQRVEATFSPLPFNDDATRAYGRVYAASAAAGRALAADLPIYTRNSTGFEGLAELVRIVPV